MTILKLMCGALMLAAGSSFAGGPVATKGDLKMDSVAEGRWRFGGELGTRIEANVENWLLRAPGANPGMLEMFSRRDRHLPYNEPVPWAGEFAGKYLISAVQACAMTDNERLVPFVQAFVDALAAGQAEDGYLGPWPKDERLLGHWDLWGHYHCMLGLLLWHDFVGDERALDCAVRAADCICDIYVDGGRRPIEAGTPQINLAVLHVMGQIYRRTGEPRYAKLMAIIEEDIQEDGDWLRKGAEGVPYHKLPGGGTRWESLHIVQGLAEQYRITGEEQYKRAVVGLWESIREFDRHPSGAFSTHECAFGTVYAQGSIETCCSVAWLALTIDVLRLTGDPHVADELELTTWNQVLASQHPSGNWCTYDNPINGVRAPSYHQINFQYRPGTPELNCCSVNAPRGFGMLGEWAVMEDADGLAINFYGPGAFEIVRRNQGKVTISQETDYPVGGKVVLTVSPEEESAFVLKLRIPAWSKRTEVRVNGTPVGETPCAGTYLALKRTWKKGDRIEIAFDMTPRRWVGGGPERGGCAAVYVGPLLLAFDAYFNEIESEDLTPIDMAALDLEPVPVDRARSVGYFPPIGLWKAPTVGGGQVVLCDFGSAGAHGTDFVGWLPAANVPPPVVSLKTPEDDAKGAPGLVLFRWETCGVPGCSYELLVSKDEDFTKLVVHEEGLDGGHAVVGGGLAEEGAYYWKVRSVNESGITENRLGTRKFSVDRNADAFFTFGDDGLMLAAPLDGDGAPSFGVVSLQEGLTPAADRFGREGGAVAFAGAATKLRYKVGFFPETDYSFDAWVCPGKLEGFQQIFSAWCRGLDDPLRVSLDGDSVFARIEAKGSWSTEGVPLKDGEWVHVAAVKEGAALTLYVNGKPGKPAVVPEVVHSACEEIGIGFNPLYQGGEHFTGRIDGFAFHARALSAEEVAGRAKA